MNEFALIKFTSLKWAKRFRKGELYLNSLDYFRKLEDNGLGRGDLLEGSFGIISKDHFDEMLPKIGLDISSSFKDAIIGGMNLLDEEQKYFKVLCLYQLNFNLSRRYVDLIDRRIKDFGNSFVLITNTEEFIKRIVNASFSSKYSIREINDGSVEYYNLHTTSQILGPFRKIDYFSWQQEYRVLFIPNRIDSVFDLLPLTINIGSIADISIIGSAEELIDKLRVDENNQLVIHG